MAYKYTTDYIKSYYAEKDCTFSDSVFLGVMHKHNYICSCGQPSSMTFNNFMKGKRCKNCGFQKRVKTYEEVQEIFAKQNAKLTSPEYIGYKQELEFICSCGRTGKRTLEQFQKSKRCEACASESVNYTYEELQAMYASKGFTLTDKEIHGVNYPHNCICICNRPTRKSWSSLRNGKACKQCQIDNTKFTVDKVKTIFAENGWEYLDNFYNGNNFKHNAKCKCGNITTKRLNDFRRKNKILCCRKCGGNYIPTIEELKLEFTADGCTLNEEIYINSHALMKYICNCGNHSEINLNNWRSGKRCRVCGDALVFDMTLPSNVYLIHREGQFKIGKNNRKSWRLVTHKNNGWEVIDKIGPILGSDASEIENTIKQMFKTRGVPTGTQAGLEKFDGYTECWSAKDFPVESLADLWEKL